MGDCTVHSFTPVATAAVTTTGSAVSPAATEVDAVDVAVPTVAPDASLTVVRTLAAAAAAPSFEIAVDTWNLAEPAEVELVNTQALSC